MAETTPGGNGNGSKGTMVRVSFTFVISLIVGGMVWLAKENSARATEIANMRTEHAVRDERDKRIDIAIAQIQEDLDEITPIIRKIGNRLGG